MGSDTSTPTTGKGTTDFVRKTFIYTWEIRKQPFWPLKFRSPIFSVGGHSWSLEFRTSSSSNSSYSSLFVNLESSTQPEVYASVSAHIVDVHGAPENVNTACFMKGSSHGISNFIAKNSLTPLIEFSIVCELNVVCPMYVHQMQNENKIQEAKIYCDYGKLLESGKFYDVIFAVDDQEIKAHKGILSVRSTVFAAMFEHEMEENKLNRVKIDDIDFEVMKEMLHFIYTGEAPNFSKMCIGLLSAAEKYALENLKVMCEQELSLNMTVETAAVTLILADLYSADQLKQHAFDFFKAHAKDIMKTDGWENLIESHMHLTPKLLSLLA